MIAHSTYILIHLIDTVFFVCVANRRSLFPPFLIITTSDSSIHAVRADLANIVKLQLQVKETFAALLSSTVLGASISKGRLLSKVITLREATFDAMQSLKFNPRGFNIGEISGALALTVNGTIGSLIAEYSIAPTAIVGFVVVGFPKVPFQGWHCTK